MDTNVGVEIRRRLTSGSYKLKYHGEGHFIDSTHAKRIVERVASGGTASQLDYAELEQTAEDMIAKHGSFKLEVLLETSFDWWGYDCQESNNPSRPPGPTDPFVRVEAVRVRVVPPDLVSRMARRLKRR